MLRIILETTVAAGMLALSGAVPASAAGDDEGGLWYYNDYGVAEAGATGATGTGVKGAVIDSVINADVPYLAGADITIREPSYCATVKNPNSPVPATSTNYLSSSHGTDMVAFIVGNGRGPGGDAGPLGVAPKANILYYATGYTVSVGKDNPDLDEVVCPAMGVRDDMGSEGNPAAFAAAINDAISDGADIISIATGGTGTTPELFDADAAAVRKGVVIVGSRPNDTVQESDLDIAGMNGVVTVQAMDPGGYLQTSSKIADPATDVLGPGVALLGTKKNFKTLGLTDGTSGATNIVAGYLADAKSKYPTATGNQLIQTPVRNTGRDEHKLVKEPRGFFGYGAVSLRHMLEVDPTTYDDVNPLVSTDTSQRPHYEDIYGSAPTSTTTEAATADSANPLRAFLPLLIIGGVVVLLIIIAVVVFVVLLTRRSRRSTGDIGTAASTGAQNPTVPR